MPLSRFSIEVAVIIFRCFCIKRENGSKSMFLRCQLYHTGSAGYPSYIYGLYGPQWLYMGTKSSIQVHSVCIVWHEVWNQWCLIVCTHSIVSNTFNPTFTKLRIFFGLLSFNTYIKGTIGVDDELTELKLWNTI